MNQAKVRSIQRELRDSLHRSLDLALRLSNQSLWLDERGGDLPRSARVEGAKRVDAIDNLVATLESDEASLVDHALAAGLVAMLDTIDEVE